MDHVSLALPLCVDSCSKMFVRIPTYSINSCYMGPLTLYLYFKYGRAEKPERSRKRLKSDQEKSQARVSLGKGKATPEHSGGSGRPAQLEHMAHDMEQHDSQQHSNAMMHGDHGHSNQDHGHHHENHHMHTPEVGSKHNMNSMNHMGGHMIDPNRPTWATVLISVSHCGAGCVLGDIVGEFLVYGTGASINGQTLWAGLLIDYAFALLFGIVFQYCSIAPMSGEYGPKTLVRAAKADILSLTAFELGLFGWMVAYQVGIWKYQLQTNSFVYWWQMQVRRPFVKDTRITNIHIALQIGMFFGFWTSAPINAYLLAKGIKEPCA